MGDEDEEAAAAAAAFERDWRAEFPGEAAPAALRLGSAAALQEELGRCRRRLQELQRALAEERLKARYLEAALGTAPAPAAAARPRGSPPPPPPPPGQRARGGPRCRPARRPPVPPPRAQRPPDRPPPSPPARRQPQVPSAEPGGPGDSSDPEPSGGTSSSGGGSSDGEDACSADVWEIVGKRSSSPLAWIHSQAV
uniref:Uncharacterized protein n=1 Tax=Sphaerodactylus townsendi TaxID=933632 RepID=A0ACB8ECW4_9SAUR